MMLSIEDAQAVESEENQERLTKLLDMAFWHNQAGNIDAAILACEASLLIQPNSTTAHSLLGSLYEKKDDDAKAIQHFEAVVRLNPESAADAAKLDQIRRGVRVKAVAPPPSYNWLPPMFLKIKREGVKAALSARRGPVGPAAAPQDRSRRSLAIIGAGATAVVVLAVGLLAIRPSHPVDAQIRNTRTAPQTMSSASMAAPSESAGLPAPIVLKPRAGTPHTVAAAPDPFAETLPKGAKTTPLIKSMRDGQPERTASLPSDDTTPLALPPLKLRAVPIDGDSGGGLAPAPVAAPAIASISNVPQHTVVVPSLGRSPYPPAQTVSAPGPQYNRYDPTPPQSNLASHIKITIDDSPATNSVSISDHSDTPSANRSGAGSSSDGDNYQQTALGLQQQGDYRGAKAAYQKAIKAYKAQIASGQNAGAASQGLAASQTGLQICDQGQQ